MVMIFFGNYISKCHNLIEKSTPVLGYRCKPSLSKKQFINYSFIRSPNLQIHKHKYKQTNKNKLKLNINVKIDMKITVNILIVTNIDKSKIISKRIEINIFI